MGGASGAGSLLLNTKASQEAACSRAPAAIVPGQEPARDAGVSRFGENGSHLAEVDAAEGHAGQVDGPGSSGNSGNGSHLEAVGAAEGHAGQVDGLGMSGNAGIGSHLEATDFSNEPGAVLWRHTPPHRTESGRLSYGTASPDSSVQKTALWRTRGSSWRRWPHGLKKVLQECVDAGDKSKPLTDEWLIIEMGKHGYEVARRTICIFLI